ncbi:AAA family ATPase [Bradyrhizobium japonicum]|uniref:AAA family ATPase n=1 Tax=Bradyrhizobium japonicum TaxID=375 RepID=UPI0006760909|nr:AAA family ATPase [Bradyrhizobium japonicum]
MNKEYPLPDSRLNGKVRLEQVVPTMTDVMRIVSSDPVLDSIENGTRPPAFRRLKLTHISELLLPTASRYLVKGIIPSVGLVVVWGPPKCGKSFFVFDLVAHIAANWEYRGRRVKQCPVVYFALEGQEGFVARVEAFRQTHGSADIPFYLSADRVILPQDGPAVVRSIQEQFPDVHPGVVVLDTLNRSISGSENDPSDMGQYVRAADLIRAALGCVVIVIHHCGIEGSRPRGHTSLTGAADAQLAVKRDAAGNVVATVEFMKDGPQGDEIVSLLEQVTVGTDDEGDPISSCVIRPSTSSPTRAKSKVTGQAALALRILANTINDEGEYPPPNGHIPPNTRTVSEKTWRANFCVGMTQDDTSKETVQKAFVRASNKLQERNLIGKWGDHVWLS